MVSQQLNWMHLHVSIENETFICLILINFLFILIQVRNRMKNNVRSQYAAAPTHSNNIQKILMNNGGYGTTTSLNIPALAQSNLNGHLSQITPGGAELNILSSCSPNGNGNIFQNQSGKLSIVKGDFILKIPIYRTYSKISIFSDINNGSKLHVMHSSPTIVVSQPQNVNIISSSSHIPAKVRNSMWISIIKYSAIQFQLIQTTNASVNTKPAKSMILLNHASEKNCVVSSSEAIRSGF